MQHLSDLLPILIPGGAAGVGTLVYKVVMFLRSIVMAQIDDLKEKHALDLDALRKGFESDIGGFRLTLSTIVEENKALRAENTGLRSEIRELRACVEDRDTTIDDLHERLQQLDTWKNHVTYNRRKRGI